MNAPLAFTSDDWAELAAQSAADLSQTYDDDESFDPWRAIQRRMETEESDNA